MRKVLRIIGKALASAAAFAIYIVPYVLAFVASTAWKGLQDGWNRTWHS